MWYAFTEILPVLAMVAVLLLFGLDIRKFRVQLEQWHISRPRHLAKLKLFHVLFSLITLLWVLEALFFLPVFSVTASVLCAFLYLIGYIAFFNPAFFELPPFFQRMPSAQSGTKQEYEEQLERINRAFAEDKLYLRPKLSLQEAADHLSLPARHISELINQYHNVDFRNYVNAFRVEEVIRKVENGALEDKTLLGIALESGFNSKSTFNKAFKDLKGESPSSFFGRK